MERKELSLFTRIELSLYITLHYSAENRNLQFSRMSKELLFSLVK